MRARSCWCSGARFRMVGTLEDQSLRKGDEDNGTVGEREVVCIRSRGRFGPFPATAAAAGKWD